MKSEKLELLCTYVINHGCSPKPQEHINKTNKTKNDRSSFITVQFSSSDKQSEKFITINIVRQLEKDSSLLESTVI